MPLLSPQLSELSPRNIMPKLIVHTNNEVHEISFTPGPSVRDILDAAGIRVRSGCRGNGACGLCLVRLEAGTANNPTNNELLLVTGEQIGQNMRLACQVTPADDISIRVIGRAPHDEKPVQGLHYDKPQLFEAFIKAAQYIVRLKTQQDVWDHLGKFMLTYFPAKWTAFVQRDTAGGLSVHHCTLPGGAAERVLTDETRVVIADVLESGFLTSRAIQTPAPSMTAFLPIVEGRMKRVMLIGHAASDPMPHELLNIYLAVAGLAGATFERLQNEHELTTHRARLEELVKERTAELEAANSELETFAYSVSHDLRAPLRAIDGFSRIIEEEQAARLDDSGKDHFRRVREAADRMDKLIEALLRLSKQTRGEMHRETVDMSQIARATADELGKTQPGREADFVIAAGMTVTGDPAMLRAMMENLLGNAWKFTAKRETARIEFGVTQREGRIVYFVRDNGAGFDMSHAKNMFAAFQRLHPSTEFPGIGIGLATVQRIIHRHGGSIWAEGEVDKGATFYFTL
jgi:signal transduction histidine kinase/ferredoxin